jgi:hypothetical protein
MQRDTGNNTNNLPQLSHREKERDLREMKGKKRREKIMNRTVTGSRFQDQL